MDPIENFKGITNSNATDTAQKHSEMLRAHRKRLLKRARKQRPANVDSSDFSADLGEMGGDENYGEGESTVFQRAFEDAYQLPEEGEREELEDSEDDEEDLDFSDQEVEERQSGHWTDYQKDEEVFPEAGSDEDDEEEGYDDDEPAAVFSREVEESEGPSSTETVEAGLGSWAEPEPEVEEEETLVVELEYAELPQLPPDLIIAPEFSMIFERLLVGSRQEPAYTRLCNLLTRFGRSVLSLCLREKASVHLLEGEQPLEAHPAVSRFFAGEKPTGACYLVDQRLMVIEQKCLNMRPRFFNPALFYFAHAFDHALGDQKFSSFGQAVKANYQVNLEGQEGHEFADCLAEDSPVRYFAQAVEAYLGAGECDEPLWTREDLHDFDKTMYQYVEYLLARKY